MTGKILVIRGGAIGDFILTLPAIAALREKFPNHRLEILGYPRIAQLAILGGLADSVSPIEAPTLSPFFVKNLSLPREWADFFADFNLILSYVSDSERIFQTNIRRCSSAQFLAGPHRPDETQSIHASEFFLRPLESFGIFKPDPIPRLKLSTPTFKTEFPLLALHPGSGSPQKNWPEESWSNLINEVLKKKTWRCLIVGGEAEGDRLQRLKATIPSDRIELADQLPLTELAQRLQSCSAFVGHDSGITHLAASLGLPVCVLWGPTNENIWRPRGEKIRLLRGGENLFQLSASAVFAEIVQMVISRRLSTHAEIPP